jgi:hypothetical protein
VNELNIPLLRKTMEYIEAHPEKWDQGDWVSFGPTCKTTMCFAGTAAYLAGAVMVPGDIERCTLPDGSRESIPGYAIEQLGLSDAQADAIFYSGPNSPRELRELVEDVIGEKL